MHSRALSRAAARRATSAGFSLIEAIVLVAVFSVVLGAVVSVSVRGARAERSAHARQEAVQAAAARFDGDVPASPGGAIAPSPPVDGWTDVVYPLEGAYVPANAGGTIPPDAPLILRQWRVRLGANGTRILDVSAVIADASTRQPVAGIDGYAVTLSRGVR